MKILSVSTATNFLTISLNEDEKEVIVPWIQMIIIFFVLNGLQRVNARREKLEKSRM